MEGFRAAEVARRFLDVVWATFPPSEAELAIALDRLIASSHFVPSDNDTARDAEAPDYDGQELYDDLENRFPDFGFYSVARPLVLGAEALEAGDAIDDLVCITAELRRVMWFDEQKGAAEAARYFHSAEPDWELQARDLGVYLHARRQRAIDAARGPGLDGSLIGG